MTMQIAQRLYENGYITYMRTDSVTLSETALSAARDQVRELFGAEYLPDAPRRTPPRSRTRRRRTRRSGRRARFRTPAQTGADRRPVPAVRADLDAHRRVPDARRTGRSVSMRLGGDRDGRARRRVLRASGRSSPSTASSRRTSRASTTRTPSATTASAGCRSSPRATRLDAARARRRRATRPGRRPGSPRPRWCASWRSVRSAGPSTYASIIGTILDRGYVYKKGTALVPSWLAFSVTRLLEEHFARLVDYDFTAALEDVLDEVANGEADRAAGGWAGSGSAAPASGEHGGLKQLVGDLGDIDAREVDSIADRATGDRRCGSGATARTSRTATAAGNVPEDLPPDELTVDKAEELLAAPSGDRRARHRPGDRARRRGQERPLRPVRHRAAAARTRPKSPKPRTGSRCSRHVARHGDPRRRAAAAVAAAHGRRRPESGEPITAQNGRYGPVPEEGHRLALAGVRGAAASTSPCDEALAIYAQPKQRGRGRRGQPPLRSSARTRAPASRSRSRTAASVRTSPTARPTRPCARATTRGGHDRARRRAAGREAGAGTGPEEAGAGSAKKSAAKKTARRRHDGEEVRRQEGAGARRRRSSARGYAGAAWPTMTAPDAASGRTPPPHSVRAVLAIPRLPPVLGRARALQPRRLGSGCWR